MSLFDLQTVGFWALRNATIMQILKLLRYRIRIEERAEIGNWESE